VIEPRSEMLANGRAAEVCHGKTTI
jgi:hypothetical protein